MNSQGEKLQLLPFDQRQVVENLGRFSFNQLFRFGIPKNPCSEWNSIFQVFLNFRRITKTSQGKPKFSKFLHGNFCSIRFCYLNFQNFRLNGLPRNSFSFCLLGENISGNFSPIRSLLVTCILEDSFEDRGKMEYPPRKMLSEATREHTANSTTHIWRRRRDLNAGHIGGMRVLSPVRPPSPPPPTPPPCTYPLH